VRQLNYRDSLRPEKQQERNQPQPNGYASVRGDAWHNIQIEHRHNEERDKVPAAKNPFQVHGVFLLRPLFRQMGLR